MGFCAAGVCEHRRRLLRRARKQREGVPAEAGRSYLIPCVISEHRLKGGDA